MKCRLLSSCSVFAILLLCLSCLPPLKRAVDMHALSEPPAATNATGAIYDRGGRNTANTLLNPAPQSSASPEKPSKRQLQEPATIPVAQWPGKTFIILEKVEMFRKFGHYLYTTQGLDNDPKPCDTAIELPNHRLKYEPFARRTIKVLLTTRLPDGEYLVSALLDTLNLTVYAKTSRGVIEGLLLHDDLVEAGWRWTGATVYSRRRLIDTYDSTRSTFSNVKVSILEPLTVVAVRPGIIPLPPKPIWLIVERPDKTRGIIPLSWSWTNVLEEKQTPGLPWDQDILEHNPRTLYPDWEPYTWETIDKHNVYKGMTRQQVLMSWGTPQTIVQKDSAAVEWTFQKSRLTFTGDSLAVIEEK